MLDLSSFSPSSLLLVLTTAIGLSGCSLGLQFDDCSDDQQCGNGEVCNAGICEAPMTTGPEDCVPLSVETCACTDSSLGNRICQDNGQFGPCDCGMDTTTGAPMTSEDSTTTNPPIDPSTSSTSSTGSDTSSGTDTGNRADTSTGDREDCITITPSALLRDQGNTPKKGSARFYLDIQDMGVGLDVEDEFRIEFWFGAEAGDYNLGTATNTQYASCRQCLRLYEDSGANSLEHVYYAPRQFLQAEGAMTVADDPQDGTVSVSLTGVRLVEVEFEDLNSIPVEGGACVYVADGTYATPAVPDAWTCDDSAFTDLTCDCGCGAADAVCDDAVLGSCERCDANGSCNEAGAGCPGAIDPKETTACVLQVPPEWTCGDETYADATCHCGCGVVDPACPDEASTGCESCNATGSCAEVGVDCTGIDADNNASCI